MTPAPLKRTLLLVAVLILPIFILSQQLLEPARAVRGKSPAVPLSGELSPEQQLAQDLALSDARVQAYTTGRRTEVFGIKDVGSQYTAASSACATADCRQVEIYDFDGNAAVVAIVNVDSRQVLDVLRQPGVHPGINKRLADLAFELAVNDPRVIEALGYRPSTEGLSAVDAGAPGTSCDLGHICVAPNFRTDNRILWAIVDLTEERVVMVNWTEFPPDTPEGSVPFTPTGCPEPTNLSRDGWSLSYEVTNSDGLRVHGVSYNGAPVLTSVKLVEWHADYGSSGYRDSTGNQCDGGGGGFPIYPYGGTQVLDLHDDDQNVIGFEVVQDFRMGNWGNGCNYRYDQRIQFFDDGRYRVVGGAYGKGCGANAMYRPLVRIDVAVDGDDGDSFAIWDGAEWDVQTTENWWLQSGPYTPEGYKWRVTDTNGLGYYLEPGVGQFGDGGLGDNAFIYVVQHHANEGDTDLGVIGACCNDDYQQGPHLYLNNENIQNENIVIWYVPQMLTDATAPDYYCWTVTGEPNPETYPCFSGPMFHPFGPTGSAPTAAFSHNSPVAVGETVSFANATGGNPPLTYAWDFGDGSGVSTEENPTYQYAALGAYTVTLTATNDFGSSTATGLVEVVGAHATAEPGADATLTYTDAQGDTTTIFVPAGAVSQSTLLVYNPLPAQTPPTGYLYGGLAFTLDAYQNGTLVPDFTFDLPVEVTMEYSDADVLGIDENSLALFYWDGAAWLDASTTCKPASLYDRHPDDNWLAVDICHLTEFALFGSESVPLHTLYLPGILSQE